jgi:hypothetical protein
MVYLQSFQMKTEKRKRKRSKKIRKAAGQHFGPRLKSAHGPGEQSQTGTPFFPFSSLTGGTRLSSQVIVFNLHPRISPETARSPRFNPTILF